MFKRKLPILFLAIFVSSLFAFGLTKSIPDNTKNILSDQNTSTPKTDPISETPLPTSTPNINRQTAKVTYVIDGDTIEIEGGQRLRYIGMDTPETKHPSKPVECYGEEAYQRNKNLVDGKIVEIEKDVSETDRYNRLLRYVYVDGQMVNEMLVREGYANASSYPPDIKYQKLLKQAEQDARTNNKGLWSDVCQNWNTPSPTVTTTPNASDNISCKYSCSSPDRDCKDFATHAEAQVFFSCCGFTAQNDPMKLDALGVGDGVACENLP